MPETRQPQRPYDCTEEEGVRFADPNECVRDKVCSASAPRACVPAHLVETTTGSGQKVMKSARDPAVDARSATCMSLLGQHGSRFRSSCCSAHHVASSLRTSRIFHQLGGCRRRGVICVASSCVMRRLFDKDFVGHEIGAKFRSK